MTFESENRIVAHHAFAVVGDFQQASTAGFDLNRDVGGAGVDRILDEFLGDRSRTFNDFAGGDLIGDVICEDSNFSHGFYR